MNAAEVIEHFKHLPREEQAKVVDFIRQQDGGEIAFASDNQVQAISEKVFSQHPELFRKLSQ
ncbi:hypothetical protein [Cerasicoccus fimbriatus]|uniref:hypothetical protein n=1 Tax=Cerasicoccus fimbriatus TaxID=3014554 RepID=UPI0022B33EAC|nr:hypothetical protein [Cerasicoccus sp. TK19100]